MEEEVEEEEYEEETTEVLVDRVGEDVPLPY